LLWTYLYSFYQGRNHWPQPIIIFKATLSGRKRRNYIRSKHWYPGRRAWGCLFVGLEETTRLLVKGARRKGIPRDTRVEIWGQRNRWSAGRGKNHPLEKRRGVKRSPPQRKRQRSCEGKNLGAANHELVVLPECGKNNGSVKKGPAGQKKFKKGSPIPNSTNVKRNGHQPSNTSLRHCLSYRGSGKLFSNLLPNTEVGGGERSIREKKMGGSEANMGIDQRSNPSLLTPSSNFQRCPSST